MARTTNKAEDLLTFSRASSGIALTKVAYGPELVTNGDFSNGTTGWINGTATISVVDGELLVINDGINYGYARQNITTVIGKTYKVTATLRRGTANQASVQVGILQAGNLLNLTTFSTTDVVLTGVFIATATTTNINTLNGAINNGSAYFDNISVKEVFYGDSTGTLELVTHPTNKPRVEYDANGVAKGLLIEEARTNIRTDSAAPNISNNYRIYGTSSPSTETAPDGTPSAILLDGRWDNYPNDYGQSSNQTQTYSAFVKPVGATSFRFSIGGSHAEYNFSSGLWSYLGLTGGFAETYPNGWIRLAATLPSKTNVYHYWGGDFLGTTTTGHVWGIQLENAPFPTSYIPTGVVTATRSADIASVSADKFGYNQAQGTLLMEFDTFSDGLSAAQYVLVGGNDTRFLYSNPGTLNWYSYDGATASTYTLPTAFNFDDTPVKAGYTEGGGSTAIYHDGNIGTAIQHQTIFDNNITNFYIGHWNGSFHLNGHIKSIKYYPVRLDDDKLKELTL